ncbi:MAG TPA: response regulator transcription factor [Aggregatilinea sp.]|jgi:DNA-binding response OmpR family regulator|uniref:response regulator transcription factor n=1 Tax=Aggregatilinea sp. TaxID=2806333 RepID=UPI002C4D821D|nr:response regulator transcription factor [Aggregatilinea sp.]HML21051.1 response regulator transcription factor [Aggregatilinea sp.]
MTTPYILAVDDDPEVLGTLTRALSREGFEVGRATSGFDALRLLADRQPDLLVLDIIMPGLDGLAVCRKIRAEDRYSDLTILFLTARGQTDDVVAGLDAGGDDYLIKPFEVAELIARVRALIRRTQRNVITASPTLDIGSLHLDSSMHQATVGERPPIQLTATEHRLLRYLMEHNNQALSPQHLLEAVWDYPPNTGDPDLVRAHVRNLRAKLEKGEEELRLIRTIHGVGYMISG